ncbi:lipopolysaccharide biosynthesis protein [Citricoccus sp. K5]|uniref:lipopolysaccharide biosynthesis protein n=1 Tax=Citricoccus sp. K5 TaxID=2653135 RepID=UPI0012F38051|nr:lipopolysaccharide biosynthesis protein [Citricoccus sp. K5]VXB06203.1 O-antigen/teichoic acid export membrane protein [Citricoccus sp. K5]
MSIRTVRATGMRGRRATTEVHTTVSAGIRRGLAWSTVSSMVLRLGTFSVGIFLARMFTPEQFGLYAVVLTVQTVMMTLADFGLSSDLIRSANHRAKAPTVATMGVLISAVLTGAMAAGSGWLADVLGAPGTGPVLAVMSLTLLIAGIGVVPYATLQRTFRQKQVFVIAVVDFVVGTVLLVALVLGGWGVMALAVSRVIAQLVAVILQFVLSGERPRYGFNRSLAKGVWLFGLPVAGANLLSWVLLGADKVLVSSLAGATVLGFYFLAFNISNWPMSVLGQVVRSVSLPAFSRVATGPGDRSLATALAPVWAVSVLVGGMLMFLAGPVIELVYGGRWLAAAPLLMVLAAFGALRTVLDLSTSYLLARGESGRVLRLQLAWMVVLLPLLVAGTLTGSGIGAAVGHVVSSIVLLALYARSLAVVGVDIAAVWAVFWPPLLAVIPAALATWLVTLAGPNPLVDLMGGGAAGTAVYGLVLYRWMRQRLSEARLLGADEVLEEEPDTAVPTARPVTVKTTDPVIQNPAIQHPATTSEATS